MSDSSSDNSVLARTATLLLVCLLAVGCRPANQVVPQAAGEVVAATVTVVAPQILEKALQDISTAFASEHPDCRLDVRTGVVNELVGKVATGKVAGQVMLFMSGPEQNAVSHLLATKDSKKVGSLFVIAAVPQGNPLKIKQLADLTKPQVRHLALPDPAKDSAGQAFAAALRGAGLWERLQRKLVTVASPHAACALVEAGEAEVAVTYSPCVLFGHSRSKLGIALFLPTSATSAVPVLAAPFGAVETPEAQRYLQYLRSPRAQAILGKHGLSPDLPAREVAASRTLLVFCGAALQPAMDVIGDTYFQRTGVRVDFSYAGAQMLLGQLAASRRGDLYMPGEAFWVHQAQRRGFVATSRPVAYFTPVLMVRKGNPKGVKTLQDLARPGVRVAVGHPTALAVGPVTKRILTRAGVWEKVQPNVAMVVGCIPELANAVAMKGADAGILWDACVQQVADHVDALPIPAKYNEVAEVRIATLRFSAAPEEAQSFADFAASPEVAAIFEREGFRTTPPAGIRMAPEEGPAK